MNFIKTTQIKITNDNKAYEPIELNGENFQILGRVVGYYKKPLLKL